MAEIYNNHKYTDTGSGTSTDNQTLSLAGKVLSIARGNSVTLPSPSGRVLYNITALGSALRFTKNGDSFRFNLPSEGSYVTYEIGFTLLRVDLIGKSLTNSPVSSRQKSHISYTLLTQGYSKVTFDYDIPETGIKVKLISDIQVTDSYVEITPVSSYVILGYNTSTPVYKPVNLFEEPNKKISATIQGTEYSFTYTSSPVLSVEGQSVFLI